MSFLKIRALPPCEIYVFGLSKTWAILCKKIEYFALKLKQTMKSCRKEVKLIEKAPAVVIMTV